MIFEMPEGKALPGVNTASWVDFTESLGIIPPAPRGPAGGGGIPAGGS